MPICRPGFACVQGQCVSACNPACVEGEVCTASLQCVPETDPAAGPPASLGMEEPELDPDVTLEGVKGFGGIVIGGGVSMHTWRDTVDNQLDRPTTWGAFLFALRAGLLVGRNEISVEFAPGTYRPTIGGGDGDVIDQGKSVTSFLGSYAHHVPITLGAYWPFRFGAGFISRSHGGDWKGTDFQARVDLLNISVKTKMIFLDFSFPSIRYVSDFETYHRWSGLFTAAVSAIGP